MFGMLENFLPAKTLETFLSIDQLKYLSGELLKRWYKREKEITQIADVFGDPELLLKYYVPPDCQHHNPADRDEDETALSQIYRPAFDTINDFLKGDFLKRDGRSQLFILSDAGMGKTSLLMMIKFHHLTAFWPQDFDCVLLKLGENTLEQVQAIENKRRTVLLLDALDEDRTAWGRIKERLEELLHATTHFHRVIISCRTQFFPEKELDPFGSAGRVVLGPFRCPLLFLSLFNDEKVDAYLQKKYPQHWYQFSWQQRPELKRAWTILQQMQSLRFRPLLLSHIDDLLESPRQDWNAYMVYEVMVDVWLRREEQKFLHLFKDNPRRPSRDDLLHACIHAAAWMQKQGTRELKESALQTLVRVADKNIAYLENFEVGGRALLNRNSDRDFRFSHYSIQEFLAIQGVVSGLLTTDDLQQMHITDVLRMFLCLAPWKQFTETHRHAFNFIFPQNPLKDGGLAPKMVFIPGGKFHMGDSQGSDGDDETPVHEVTISSLFVSQYPATFAEYDAFCTATGQVKPRDEGQGRGQRPVINVSWQEAVAYCDWLSQQTGRTYRLLSEAEWEYACRAGSDTDYCFGNAVEQLADYAWYGQNAGNKTRPVGEKQANVWGLYDMHGNVWEWTQDWYGKKYYSQSPDTNPAGAAAGKSRVLRGGSWFDDARNVRSACRGHDEPDGRLNNIGFRCALVQA